MRRRLPCGTRLGKNGATPARGLGRPRANEEEPNAWRRARSSRRVPFERRPGYGVNTALSPIVNSRRSLSV
jgi:hypothetical protein